MAIDIRRDSCARTTRVRYDNNWNIWVHITRAFGSFAICDNCGGTCFDGCVEEANTMLDQARNRNENPMIFNINRRNTDARNGEVGIGAQ